MGVHQCGIYIDWHPRLPRRGRSGRSRCNRLAIWHPRAGQATSFTLAPQYLRVRVYVRTRGVSGRGLLRPASCSARSPRVRVVSPLSVTCPYIVWRSSSRLSVTFWLECSSARLHDTQRREARTRGNAHDGLTVAIAYRFLMDGDVLEPMSSARNSSSLLVFARLALELEGSLPWAPSMI